MFDRPVISADAIPVGLDDQLAPLQAMLATIGTFAGAKPGDAAGQCNIPMSDPGLLATRYAAANSITRRRFDAILRETETVGRAGLKLISGRSGRSDPAAVAAARFLGNTVGTALRRLEKLLPPQPI